MASKKQRKRREKDRRHDWEYVYVDGEGQEVEVDEASVEPRAPKKATKTPAKSSGGRGRRPIEPPSWSRVGKRALIFAPLMLVVVYFLQGKNHDYRNAIVQTIVLLAFFLPFSYLMDTMMYRSYRKRLDARESGTRATKR
jgi:hypothetical protein